MKLFKSNTATRSIRGYLKISDGYEYYGKFLLWNSFSTNTKYKIYII